MIKLPRLNCTSQPFHHTLIVPEVMNRVESCTEDLTAFIEVMKVGSTVVPTGIAITGLVNWALIGSVRCVTQFQDASIDK